MTIEELEELSNCIALELDEVNAFDELDESITDELLDDELDKPATDELLLDFEELDEPTIDELLLLPMSTHSPFSQTMPCGQHMVTMLPS